MMVPFTTDRNDRNEQRVEDMNDLQAPGGALSDVTNPIVASRNADVYGYEDLVMDQYTDMYLDLKHILIGEYFSPESLNMENGDVYDWHDEYGFKFSDENPLMKFLEKDQIGVARVVNSIQADTHVSNDGNI